MDKRDIKKIKKRKEKKEEKPKPRPKPIKPLFTGRFNRAAKNNCGKDRIALAELDADIAIIISNPKIGIPKTGDLRGVRVHKVKRGTDELLIAYKFDKKKREIEFYDFDVHENYYEDLKNYLRRK
ncbi:MAG: type II toxin-antitoxin system RelE/ParE family toxin [Candidatus Marinimicrobia bacterium]|nr:type II toxin-antitoxin system RelE/ParE family toxin [Candidatus Neomarinimicrobiota bacterium]